jgi:tetratricopeptide (TPR) repeat protein
MNFGLELARRGDVGAGIEHLDVAVRLDPGNAYVHLLRGNLLHEAGETDAALADYAEAVKSPRRAPTALVNRAVIFLEQGEIDLAMRALNSAIKRAPDEAVAYVARANAHLAKAEYDAAWTDVKTARRLGRPPSQDLVDRLTSESGRSE